jgi:hypothetical protein
MVRQRSQGDSVVDRSEAVAEPFAQYPCSSPKMKSFVWVTPIWSLACQK